VSCGDGGILGPVVGVMGVLQALEAIKVITGGSNGDGGADNTLNPPSMLLFSAYSNPPFRSIKLRRRNAKCSSCSTLATVTAEALTSGSMDYIQFCGIANPVNVLYPEERISAIQYAEARKDISLSGKQHQVIDVREKVQFELCHLYGSVNVPFSMVQGLRSGQGDEMIEGDGGLPPVLKQLKASLGLSQGEPVYVVCRLGNDSQIAVRKFKELGFDRDGRTWIGDVKGGLKAWREHVDPSFPEY
jgi:adenylyltransferase/sulfurtransferase